ncbi:MAG: hypothetical protein LC104_13775 [Bacteroidales bacterium]|nr:hypothetical protein [Bacteroidales bacterium]
MRREDVLDVIRRMDPGDITLTVLTFQNGAIITLDSLVRSENEYMVVRGREGGTTDEGRAFFVPYADISYIKLDKKVRTNQIRRMYGEKVELDREEQYEAGMTEVGGAAHPDTASGTPAPTAQPLDPAAIAKQNLLDRIRATRTSAGTNKPR